MSKSQFQFPSFSNHVKKASQEVLDSLKDIRMDESILFDIRLCFEEAFINAAKHGNKNDPRLIIRVDVIKSERWIEIVICDCGKGFGLEECQDPTREENLTKLSGRGIYLIKQLMDEVKFEKNSGCLHMKKNIYKKEPKNANNQR